MSEFQISEFQIARRQATAWPSLSAILKSDLGVVIAFSLAGLVATVVLATQLSSLAGTALALAQLQ